MSQNENNATLSEFERAALKTRTAELRRQGTRSSGKAAADSAEVAQKIAGMSEGDRALAQRFDELVKQHAPELAAKLYYGQPAYARGKQVVCFFRSGTDDAEPYSTVGFTSGAHLDEESGLWATSFALVEMTPAAEEHLSALLQRAVVPRGAQD